MKARRVLLVVFALVLALRPMVEDVSLSQGTATTTINLEDIDSGLTSPTGEYRWLDVADQPYSEDYRTNYNYTQANVDVTYHTVANALHGTLNATNLKPNFAYQLKLVGFPGIDGNECIGLAGRWWEEEWNGSEWTNGHNLNNKGDGSSPNPNDSIYFARRDITDPTSPTGLKYRYTGYLLFDYFITDENGDAILDFEANSSYHVLFTTSQRAHGAADGPLKSTTFDADSSAAYDDTGGDDYPSQTVSVFGEWERLPVGGVYLQPGDYSAQMILTEESFHGSGGSFAGCWAAAMGADVEFTIVPESNSAPVVADIPDQTIAEGELFVTINLDNYVSDVDNTDAEMTWTYSGNSELSVTIVDRVATISIPDPDWKGAETITFTATDPEDASDSDDAIFTPSMPLLWVDPDDETIPVGQEINVDVMIIANEMCGLEFNLDFDPTLLEVIDADNNPDNGTQISVGSMWAGMDYWVIQNTVNDGTIEFGAFLLGHDYCPSDFAEEQVAQITFHGIGAGISPLNLNDVIVGGPESVNIEPVFLEDGTLTVVEHGTVQGIVEVQGRPGDWDGAEITVSGPGGTYNASTDSDGTWSISSILAGIYDVAVEMARYLDGLKTGVSVSAGDTTDVDQVTVLGGDCNDDGTVNMFDATILGPAFGSVPAGPNWDARADINDSGKVDIFDAVLLGGNWHKSNPVPW